MSNTQWLSDVAARLQNLLPQLLAAAALIVAGWLLGLVLRFLTVRLLTRFVERAGRTGNLKRAVDDLLPFSAPDYVEALFTRPW